MNVEAPPVPDFEAEATDKHEISGVFAHRWSSHDKKLLYLTGWVGRPSICAQWLSEDSLGGAQNECLVEYKASM